MYLHVCASVCVSVYELTGWLLRNKTSANVKQMVLKTPIARSWWTIKSYSPPLFP